MPSFAPLCLAQSEMATHQKQMEIIRREMDDISVKLSSCVSYRELEEVKAMEGRLGARCCLL